MTVLKRLSGERAGATFYCAIDRDGNLVDSRLSEKRNTEAAKQFFSQAVATVDHVSERVTTDGYDSYSTCHSRDDGNLLILPQCKPVVNRADGNVLGI
nr:DDE-type integrase/transposase/recombinase [Ktedonospora formicarum]